MEIEGRVEAIGNENNNGHEKKVITLATGKDNVLFVEFQGRNRGLVKDVSTGDRVRIKIRFNGKVSNLGRRYNNIIGKSLTKREQL